MTWYMSTQTRAFIRVKLKVARNENRKKNFFGFLFTCKKLSINLFFLKSALEWANSSQIALFSDSLNMHILSTQILNHNFFGILFRKDKSQNLFIFCQSVTATHRPDYMICHFLDLSINICQQYILARYRIHYKIQESIKVQL